jgi:phosphoribosylglycinamide formyltransferase 1
VLASGTGTLLQSLLDSHLRASIIAVGSDVPDCRAMDRAKAAGITTFAVPMISDRSAWNEALLTALDEHHPDAIVSAGFMRILGPTIVAAYRDRIVNTHPALLPQFPGAHAVRDALAAGISQTGCTVHLVDEGVDTGPVLAQEIVTIEPDDDEAALHERIKAVERRLLVTVLDSWLPTLNHGGP